MGMKRILAAIVFMLGVLGAGQSHAQSTTCTPTTQANSLTALADGQAAGSITPRVMRNTLCAQTTSITNVTTTTYAASNSDQVICVTQPSAGVTVTLASSPITGLVQTVSDCGQNAAIYNITVQPATGTIFGNANVLMNLNNESLEFEYTGSAWV